ncbi:hypothetical protein DRZ78_00095 [Candidatus Aerophobetes bacterium]|uniref:Sugar ABC transporter substrate-binding protein n=1 Tax=Aerophobetes bacterium TaxID=2030807 RepID=A0A662D7F7_UNCAE|nr:MAG: hypothetical protein DRZ78_00095 [Candidatus Aerophobetes bacterium]
MHKKLRKVIMLTAAFSMVMSTYGGLAMAAEKSPFAGETVTIMVHPVPHATGIYMFKDKFEKKYGIKLNVIEVPPESLYEKAMTEFVAESGAYDLVDFNPAWIADYSRFLEPLGPLAKRYNLDFKLDDVMPIFRMMNSWAGKWYAMPWDGDTHMLYYRKDIFDKFGLKPPKTFEDFLNIAKFLNGWDWDNDGEIEYGCASYLKRGRTYWWFLGRFAGYGGNYFDKDMNPLINTEAGVKALKNLVECIKYMPPGALNYSYMELRTAYVKGDVPMCIQWTCVGKAAEDPNESKIVGKTGYGLYPGGKTMIAGGWQFGIPKTSKHKGAAIQCLQFYTNPENSLQIVMNPATSLDPYRKSHYRAPEFRRAWPTAGEYLDAIEANLRQGFPDLEIPGAAEYMDALDYELCLAYAGEKPVKKALDDAAKKWNEITRRMGKEKQKEAWLAQLEAMKILGIGE